VLRIEIEILDRLDWSQHDTQLQLCVPVVTLKGDSYRTRNRDLGRTTPATTHAGKDA
jgi:hypothetical protein